MISLERTLAEIAKERDEIKGIRRTNLTTLQEMRFVGKNKKEKIYICSV